MRFLIVLAACAVAACATVPAPAPDQGGFSVIGRFAVRYGEEAASGRLIWRHGDATDHLVLSTPLGQGVAEITRREGIYSLTTSNGRRYSAADPGELTQQALGWPLPLAGLPDWLQARPQPDIEARTRYDGDRLAELQQLGWLIQYSSYDERSRLPKRIQLMRGDLDIRLVIDEWQVMAPQ